MLYITYQKILVSFHLAFTSSNVLVLGQLSSTEDQIFALPWGANTRSIALQEAISKTSYRNILIQYRQSLPILKNKGSQRYQKSLPKDEHKAKLF